MPVSYTHLDVYKRQAIGLGKGTVELDDFDHCDLVSCIGHNPGTNHPRMLTTLRDVARRGAKILSLIHISVLHRSLPRYHDGETSRSHSLAVPPDCPGRSLSLIHI